MSATAKAALYIREPTTAEWSWILGRMDERDLLCGTTTRDIRVERWRKEILKRGWAFADSAAGRRSDGTLESWAALFLRATGELLDATHVITGEPAAVKNGGISGGPKKYGESA